MPAGFIWASTAPLSPDKPIVDWWPNTRRQDRFIFHKHGTMVELVNRFWQHAKTYYVDPVTHRPTSALCRFKEVLRPLVQIYGDRPITEFSPKRLQTIRQIWINKNLARQTVNGYTQMLKSVFRWAVEQELAPGSLYHALSAVQGLKRGRSSARESAPVLPVAPEHITAIQPYVSPQVWDLIQLQLLCGARPGELLGLRPLDLQTGDGQVWSVALDQHKTSHYGHQRVLWFGPQAQAILSRYLANRAVNQPLFSPREAEADRKSRGFPSMKGRTQANPRRPDQLPNPKVSSRRIREQYDTASYRKAIARGCDKAGIPGWHPHQLRHNFATRMRREHGIDMAQTILGHRLGSNVTEIYAEANHQKAKLVMAQLG